MLPPENMPELSELAATYEHLPHGQRVELTNYLKRVTNAYQSQFRAVLTALDPFIGYTHQLADEHALDGEYEDMVSGLRDVDPRGRESLPRRMATVEIELTRVYRVELPRDDYGDYEIQSVGEIEEGDEIREDYDILSD